MKYCMLTSVILKNLETETPMRSGLYKWLEVLDGDVQLFRERMDLEQYDIVHINLSGGDVGIIQPVVEKLRNSSTQVVVGNDYSLEMWQEKMPYNPLVLTRCLRGVDWFFGTEMYTANFLKNLTQRKEVYTIPHPVDVKFLERFREKRREERIGIIYHRYDNQIWVPWTVTNDSQIPVWLMGYHGANFDKNSWSTMTLFDGIKTHRSFQQHLSMVSKSSILYEPTTYFTWSRTAAEAAAMGSVMFGSNRGDAMRRCYPDLCCDPFDVTKLRRILAKLVADHDYRQVVVDYAVDNAGYYSLDNAKSRFLACVKDNEKNQV